MDVYTFQSFIKAIQAFVLSAGLFKSILIGLIFLVVGYFVLVGIISPFFERMRYERVLLVAADSEITESLSSSADTIGTEDEPISEDDELNLDAEIETVPEEDEMTNAAEIEPISEEDEMTKTSIKTGDITVTGNEAPTQVNIGSPDSKQIINQQRGIKSKIEIVKTQRGKSYVLQVVMNQTSGFWDQGSPFQLQAKFTGPYKKASIVQGLPPAMFNVLTSENKETGEYFFSTTTAPFPDLPIILEVISVDEINLEKLGVSPLANE